MIVAQISDTHIALDAPDADRRLRDFEAAIADINMLDPLPDVIVHTGDIVHNGRADEYQRAASTLAKARAPVLVLVGNKDHRARLRAAFAGCAYLLANSEFVQYSIEDHPVRLLALDTQSETSNKGDYCRDRIRHLSAMLDADTTRPVAVFTHHPPFEISVGPEPLHFASRDAMAELCRALRCSGRVIGIFSGHVHRSTAGHVEDIPAIVAPCIATTLRKGAYPALMKGRPVYHLHRFDRTWGFSTESRIVGGSAGTPPSIEFDRTLRAAVSS